MRMSSALEVLTLLSKTTKLCSDDVLEEVSRLMPWRVGDGLSYGLQAYLKNRDAS